MKNNICKYKWNIIQQFNKRNQLFEPLMVFQDNVPDEINETDKDKYIHTSRFAQGFLLALQLVITPGSAQSYMMLEI